MQKYNSLPGQTHENSGRKPLEGLGKTRGGREGSGENKWMGTCAISPVRLDFRFS
jgi:hypothetical protein